MSCVRGRDAKATGHTRQLQCQAELLHDTAVAAWSECAKSKAGHLTNTVGIVEPAVHTRWLCSVRKVTSSEATIPLPMISQLS